jgi:uncharacterized membrane protein
MNNKESADMRFVRAFMAACVIVLAVAPAAFAQASLEMTTDYPSVVADPSAKVTFPVKVITDTPQTVQLTVANQPDGWSTVLRGGGSTIAAVTTKANPDVAGEISATFNAEVTVPATVAPATNEVVIEGSSGALTTTQLSLNIVTQEQQPGSVTLATDAPALRGATTANFSFSLTLTNDTNSQQTFNLETDQPAGWTVEAKPVGADLAATAVVDAGANATISVSAKAPPDAPADTYPIAVRAVADTVSAEAQLSVEITGSYAMQLDTSDSRLNARVSAGGSTVVNLVINNNGTAPITGLTLASTPPGTWTVTFDPETQDIQPQTQATAQATITAPPDALAGDYVITIRATSANANDSIDIRTTVETSPIGYLIGIAVLVAVAIGLFFVFQRYGRR